MLQFRAVARSHVGLVRTRNEDSAFAGARLVLVADGMGGAAAGDVASALVTRVTRAVAQGPESSWWTADHPMTPLTRLARAVEASAGHLRAVVADDPSRAGMGSTLTALLTDGVRCGLLHLGDSRAYRLRGGHLTPLTDDHTLVRSLVAAGRMAPSAARTSPRRHLVTRALGTRAEPRPDLGWTDVAAGDRLLLCSDGLSDLVEDHRIAERLRAHPREHAADALVRDALAAGAPDNVSVVVADVVDVPTGAPGARPDVESGSTVGAAAVLWG